MHHLGNSPTTPSFSTSTTTTTTTTSTTATATAATGIPNTSSNAESALDPTTRSRTLLFLSYRDSRAPRSRFARSSRSRYLFDADEEDDDDDSSENAGLLKPKAKHKPVAAAATLDNVESGAYVSDGSDALPPVWSVDFPLPGIGISPTHYTMHGPRLVGCQPSLKGRSILRSSASPSVNHPRRHGLSLPYLSFSVLLPYCTPILNTKIYVY